MMSAAVSMDPGSPDAYAADIVNWADDFAAARYSMADRMSCASKESRTLFNEMSTAAAWDSAATLFAINMSSTFLAEERAISSSADHNMYASMSSVRLLSRTPACALSITLSNMFFASTYSFFAMTSMTSSWSFRDCLILSSYVSVISGNVPISSSIPATLAATFLVFVVLLVDETGIFFFTT
jgi:hypothetical protein